MATTTLTIQVAAEDLKVLLEGGYNLCIAREDGTVSTKVPSNELSPFISLEVTGGVKLLVLWDSTSVVGNKINGGFKFDSPSQGEVTLRYADGTWSVTK